MRLSFRRRELDSITRQLWFFAVILNYGAESAADFSTPGEQIYFPDIGAVCLCHYRSPPRVKLFSHVAHQDMKSERITSASSWVDVRYRTVGRAVSDIWFLLLSSASLSVSKDIYIRTYTEHAMVDVRELMARPFVPRITYIYTYAHIYSVFPSQPGRLC